MVRPQVAVPAAEAGFAGEARRRSQGYWLLSRLFLELPTPARLAELRDALAATGSDADPFRDDTALLRNAVGAALAAPDAAAVEFTRRFVTMPKDCREPLPFESHVREDRLPGEATEQVRLLAAAWGYGDVAPDSGSPDHLGAELRLMALLCLEEREAWLGDDRLRAVESLRRQKQFLDTHLARWAPGYCAELASRSGNEYMQAIARITASAVTADVGALEAIFKLVDADRAPRPAAAGR